jgi:mannose-1-phosphate guanylyltransferase
MAGPPGLPSEPQAANALTGTPQGGPAEAPAALHALILAGGSGTRFWPLSRRLRPKQLLALEGEESLLRATVGRLSPLVQPRAIWVCTTRDLAAAVRRELPEVPPEQVLVEPEGRNTAPAIGWSVRSMPEAVRGGVVAVLPADHRVGEPQRFRDVLAGAAQEVAARDRVMTLGVTPRWAETGYGYLELEADAGEADEAPGGSEPPERGNQREQVPGADQVQQVQRVQEVQRVRRFVEKPSPEDAVRFLGSGRYLWNAGIFVFRGGRLLELLARHEPELARGLEQIAAAPERLAEIYPLLPARSIDYAVMEKLDSLFTLPLDCGWSDLGSWGALEELLPSDALGNAGRGDYLALDAAGNLLFSDSGTIAVLGVEDLIVVRTGDAVLVMPKSRSQEVRRLVQELASRRREELL